MRRWILLIARLYLKRWRQRYGAEFGALLEDATPTWRDAVDVVRVALEMHMKMWSFWKLAAICAAAGAILAAAAAYRMPDEYASEAVVLVSGSGQKIPFFGDLVGCATSAGARWKNWS